MDADLVGRLDNAAAQAGVTRSEFVRGLVEAEVSSAGGRVEHIPVAGRSYTVSVSRDRHWWIGSVNELPGCGSQGRTLDELRDMLADAIEGYLIVRGDLPDDARTSAAR
jgi:predicted RNase H-like HicB family nuclease